jgi:serine/threonine protein kinase
VEVLGQGEKLLLATSYIASDSHNITSLQEATSLGDTPKVELLLVNEEKLLLVTSYMVRDSDNITPLIDPVAEKFPAGPAAVGEVLAPADYSLANQQLAPDVKASSSRSVVSLLFRCDYENIGGRTLGCLLPKDIRNLRETCLDMRSMLFQTGSFSISITPARLRNRDWHSYPRLYPTTQDSHCTCLSFQPLPAAAVVQQVGDFQKIAQDTRFVIKSIVFTGQPKDLPPVQEALPEHLKESLLLLAAEEKPILFAAKEEPSRHPQAIIQEDTAIIDPANSLYNSFIGVNKLPAGKVVIGPYVAEGAFGKVYRGRWGGQTVALKRIDFANAAKNFMTSDEAIKEAMQWEVSCLSTVSHPNVVQFYGLYQDRNEGYLYLVMEFCEGGTLQEALAAASAPPWSKRWQWALQTTEALAYLHKEGMLHRDLKAGNVLLDSYERAKLADLGLAQVDVLLQAHEAKVVGEGLQDKRFIAPETVNSPTLSSKETDVYALGLVFWQLASKEEPRRLPLDEYESWSKGNHDSREPIPIDCPKSLKKIIFDCWTYRPNNRPSAVDLVARLENLGPEYDPDHYGLIKAGQKLEKIIHPKRKEGLSYIAPFVTQYSVEESIESYWSRVEAATAKGETAKNPPFPLQETFEAFIKAPGANTLLLLGEAGLGKTLTVYRWADQLLTQWWGHINIGASAPAYFPIFIRPSIPQWTHEGIKGAFQKVAGLYQLPASIQPLVFVDGYDELGADEGEEDTPNLIHHLGLQEAAHAKLIITCRPTTVVRDEQEARFSFHGKLTTRHFLPFNIDQLLTYLKNELS